MRLFISLIVLLLAAAGHVRADEPAICKQLRRRYADNAHLQISFEQRIYWSVREKTSKKRGTAQLAPGGKFRVTIGSDTWVCDGIVCTHYNKNNNQVVLRNFSDLEITTRPSHLFTTLLTNYRYVEKSRTDREVTLEWHPDSASSGKYASLILKVAIPEGTVTMLKFTDTNANIHTYTFKKTVFGRKPPASTFEFEAPENAHIVDNRH